MVALELVRRVSPASAAVSARLPLPDSGGIELRLDAVPTLLNGDLPGTKCAITLCFARRAQFFGEVSVRWSSQSLPSL